MMERENKETRYEDPIKAWKEHNQDNRLMHCKIEVIAGKLCIQLYPAHMVASMVEVSSAPM